MQWLNSMDKIFTLNLLFFALLGLALAWSDVGIMDKPLNFFVIVVLVLLIQNNGV